MSLTYYSNLMLEVMLPMAMLIAAGGFWRRSLGESGVRAVRQYISTITIYLFAPALMFAAAASAHLDRELLSVPILVTSGILIGGGVLYAILRWTPLGRDLSGPTRAALLLCGMFGNVLFMGYPLLHFLYGAKGAQYAVFSDMAASTPLLWSLGVAIATHVGGQVRDPGHPVINWLKLPPVWAFVLGVLLNVSGWSFAPLVHAAQFVGQPAVPVMLLMLGVSVPWRRIMPNRVISLVVVFKLVLVPLLVWGLARVILGPLQNAQIGAVIESGVPTMLMTLGLSDRYRLDIETTALTIAWTTLLMVLVLPCWLAFLG